MWHRTGRSSYTATDPIKKTVAAPAKCANDKHVECVTFNGITVSYVRPHLGDHLTELQQTENSHALGLAIKDIPGIENILIGMRIENAIRRGGTETSGEPLASVGSPAMDTTPFISSVPATTEPISPALPNPSKPSETTSDRPLSPLSDASFNGQASSTAKPAKLARRSTRQIPEEKGHSGAHGSWTTDAAAYLREVFAKNPFKEQITNGFLEMEAAIRYPTGKVRTLITCIFDMYSSSQQARDHKLSVEGRPAAITKWVGSGRDFSKIPTSVQPLDKFIKEFIKWYRSLQPKARPWPETSPCPSLSGPNVLAEWNELRKVGPNGVFTILMGLSWICDLAETLEHRVALEWLSADITFVLGTVSRLAAAGAPGNGPTIAQAGSTNLQKKRKADENTAEQTKKKRRT